MLGRLGLKFHAARELGFRSMGNFALYQFGLRTGHYRRTLRRVLSRVDMALSFRSPLDGVVSNPWRDFGTQIQSAPLNRLERVLSGRFLRYGGEEAEIDFLAPNADLDWSGWHPSVGSQVDIKDYWEPARFGWAIPLAQAYHSRADSRYAAFFWQEVEEFARYARPYRGVHWISAQEAAIRLIHLVFCVDAFAKDAESTPERMRLLSTLLQEHALRIPPTLPYAKAQNNNHLLSEAAGLFTAGAALPGHPMSAGWMEQGWREFERGLIDQIAEDGSYIQQSVCYHRLMLTLAVWMQTIRGGHEFSSTTKRKLAKAAQWLERLVVGANGEAPNLGSNDGSLVLPFGGETVTDYRPVALVAGAIFAAQLAMPYPQDHASFQKLTGRESIAFLRCAEFKGRPSHADQLSVDLWWRGENVLRDPGTFRYNAQPPWENALAGTDVHNTLTVDERDQMQRVGRFLWADWAQGVLLQPVSASANGGMQALAEHPGYRKQNILHRRSVSCDSNDTWTVEDILEWMTPKVSHRQYDIRIQWLLPDGAPQETPSVSGWSWAMDGQRVVMRIGSRTFAISVHLDQPHTPVKANLFQAGQCLWGEAQAKPYWGWYSPTYGVRQPALSLAYRFCVTPPVKIVTQITLGDA